MKKISYLLCIGCMMVSTLAAAQEAAPVASTAPEEAPSAAQAAVAADQATSNGCEIHIWPAERFTARTTGWLSGFGAIGAMADASGHATGDAARRGNLASALESESQTQLLASMDLVKLLNTQSATIIRHSEPLDRKTVNKIMERRAQSQSPCYSELMVTDIFYQKAAIYGRSLKTLFMFRRFGAAQTNPAIYKGWGGNGLKLFPPKEGEDVQAANAELVSVFKSDFEEFAKNARMSPALASAK
ncbi:hypothetical protein [Sphingobium subterraneum]|uniref:Uncharacterized protein n=1 Tax=Sphingobium subterraneum TaxID=627688 RepID=A0A841J1B0_9SPHN|nr:hypothetical protein [Sphingobium subterraneum]MBB6124440.1 hypothetical protein [Sphingobium subterraneum]